MKIEEIQRKALNYSIGGSIPILILMPFLLECINIGYENVTGKSLTRWNGSILYSFAFFILLFIIFTSSVKNCIKEDTKDTDGLFSRFYLYSSFYLLIGGYFLLSVFYIPKWLCILLSFSLFLLFLYLYQRIKKKLS